MKDDREKMLAGRWRCPQCNYSVPPKSIKTERKHFTAHSLQCERCKYQTETKPSWDEAIVAYRSPREATPSFNDAIEAAAKGKEFDRMLRALQRIADLPSPEFATRPYKRPPQQIAIAALSRIKHALRALALPAPGGKK